MRCFLYLLVGLAPLCSLLGTVLLILNLIGVTTVPWLYIILLGVPPFIYFLALYISMASDLKELKKRRKEFSKNYNYFD